MNEPLHILVIDDSADDRLLYRRVLKAAFGDRLSLAEEASGEAGLEAIANAEPHCVLLDYSLPGRNGVEILKRIRSSHAHLPVILLTGQGNEAIAVQSMKEGAQDYITKAAISAETLGRVIRMAIENRALQKRVDEQHVALELFTHALSHDLREPVRTINSFAQILCDGDVADTDRDGHMRRIRDAGVRMGLLIETVFSYTQLDGEGAPKREEFGLDEAVAGAIGNLSALIHERGATVSVDPLPSVAASRIQVIQVFQNLISNAISHTPGRVNVSVRGTRVDGAVRVFVQDDGPGIAPEHQGQIFEPFRRLNRDNVHAGLGLAISRKIVEMHGGKISCDSTVGAGATFSFALPAAVAANEAGAQKEPVVEMRKATESAKVANVLLVDDRDDDILLTRAYMTGRGGMNCNILVAHDGKEGLAAIREQGARNDPVDLILLDINMPTMNGFEMLEAMAGDAEHNRIPVVMCSGSTQEKDRERSRNLGAVGYLIKPVRFEQLLPAIAGATGLRLAVDAAGQSTLLRVS